jgi:hypothetical protein
MPPKDPLEEVDLQELVKNFVMKMEDGNQISVDPSPDSSSSFTVDLLDPRLDDE